MAEVILENVGKVYPGGVQAVKDFNLGIQNYALFPHIVARVDARTDVVADTKLNLHLDMSRVHIFDTDGDQANLALMST